MPRVAITGIGVVSAFGVGREAFWDAIRRGQSGTRAITEFDVSTYPCQVAAPVPPLDIDAAVPLAGEHGPREAHADPRRYSRAALFGVLAAREAWNDAGLAFGEPNAGVIIGSGGGGIDVGERQYQDFFPTGGKHVTPYAIAVGICGMVSSEISIALGLHGISHVLSTGCTSSTDALGYASMLLRQGDCDVLLSGGTDGCVLPGMIFGFSRMRAVSTHYNDRAARGVAAVRSRPRRVRARRGRVDAGARARGSRPRARRARSTPPSTATPRPATPTTACRWIPTASRSCAACSRRWPRSGRAPEEIGYINYHGTSTQLNDAIESRCTRLAFGPLADACRDRPPSR